MRPARYLTDGVNLYQVLGQVHNYGLLYGSWTLTLNCLTLRDRLLAPLETALLTEVVPEPES